MSKNMTLRRREPLLFHIFALHSSNDLNEVSSIIIAASVISSEERTLASAKVFESGLRARFNATGQSTYTFGYSMESPCYPRSSQMYMLAS